MSDRLVFEPWDEALLRYRRVKPTSEPAKPAREQEPAASVIREGELTAHVSKMLRIGEPLNPDCPTCRDLMQRLGVKALFARRPS